jgi:hypothetical protein
VLTKARQLDIAMDSSSEALYEALNAGINIWCIPEDHPQDHPQDWDGVPLIAGAFTKPFGFVGTATWMWENKRIVTVSLGTDAYDLADHRPEIFTRTAWENWSNILNCPEDLEWVERKVRWLFEQAGVRCLPIVVE